jgi:hypothetical protein
MTFRHFVISVFIALCSLSAGAQEVLRSLQVNPALIEQTPEIITKSMVNEHPALTLPFFDDFSYPGPWPDSRLWEDKHVFVNQTFARHPKTLGTATFDALDQQGRIYQSASDFSFQFEADFLTSRTIRLDSVFTPVPMALTAAHNIALIFYYQPQGNGSAPRLKDSLVVEFLLTPGYFTPDTLNPGENLWVEDEWVSIWSTEGDNLESFIQQNQGKHFRRAAIPITQSEFLRKDFKFRFRNYASYPMTKTLDNYAGNISIWNVDYITLDFGRNINDDFYYDIAFAAPAQSLLRDYTSMPWSHYLANPQRNTRANLNIAITNLDKKTHNYLYRYFVMDESNAIIRNYSGGTWNIAPYDSSGYQSYAPHALPQVVPNPFGSNLTPASSREFRIFHVIRQGTTGDDRPANDTIMYRQRFSNFFAYDDGVPENGYGLVGFNPKGAVRFILGHRDYLDAVQFYFNPTLNGQNVIPIRLKVWKNLAPEVILYESDVFVEYGPSLNGYVTYKLSTPLEVSDTIYVGWQQSSAEFLNLGYDASNNASAHIFYNVTGEWLPSIYRGALMIRPVFGIDKLTSTNKNTGSEEPFTVFPNPVKHNHINLRKPHNLTTSYQVLILDMSGKVAASFDNETLLDVSHLNNGIYFLQIRTATGNQYSPTRFIIAR